MSGQLSPISGCKEMLLWKLTYAISCSVFSQVIFLIIFLFIMNFSILHPVQWIQLTSTTLTSLSTWLYLIPLTTIIFAQGVICSKDYIYENSYKTTRFLKLVSMFSLRNLFMGTLHAFTGCLIVWLYLALLGGKYGSLWTNCHTHKYCLVEDTCFLLLNGIWVGLYYFLTVYVSGEINIIFPVIQQRKLLAIKSTIVSKLRQSMKESILPTFIFICVYYYQGFKACKWVASIFSLLPEKDPLNLFDLVNSPLLIYSWMFSTLFIFTILCMRLFFEVFLTEQVSFPIESEYAHIFTLQEALSMNNLPIVQHLACLDFYNLSIWDPIRRQQLFTLSQPGGHPHNWNRLLDEVLRLITEFSSDINKTTDLILSPETMNLLKPELEENVDFPFTPVSTFSINPSTSSLESMTTDQMFQSPYSRTNLRNMALPRDQSADIVSVTYNKFLTNPRDALKSAITDKVKQIIEVTKKKSAIQYLFGEVPESRIYFLLSKGQPVIWAIQGLSFLVTASFTEDKYGVVQKDLPVIATSLITLKQNLDKLNKVSFVNRKSMQGEPMRMQLKIALRTAVRRTLYNICNTFGDYLTQMPLSKEIHQQMQAFVLYKEG